MVRLSISRLSIIRPPSFRGFTGEVDRGHISVLQRGFEFPILNVQLEALLTLVDKSNYARAVGIPVPVYSTVVYL